MPRPQTAPGLMEEPQFTANDLELAKIRIAQGVEKVEAYLRSNRRLTQLTEDQNNTLRKKILTDFSFKNPSKVEAQYNNHKIERKTMVETVRMDYVSTNASLRKRCKKLDRFVNCIMYGTDKAPKNAADAAIDPSARENARVPVASYADLSTPHCAEPNRMIINACTCCVPYKLPSKEERLAFKLRLERRVSVATSDGDEAQNPDDLEEE